MNGSRPSSHRPSDRSSLDALNRTIEGLEARIEGLMSSSRDRAAKAREQNEPRTERSVSQRLQQASAAQTDPLSEIRERQRMLAASRQVEARAEHYQPAAARYQAPRRQTLDTSAAYRQAPDARAPRDDYKPAPQRTAAPQRPAMRGTDTSMEDIAQALLGLRQDLKQDIADGVSREIAALNSELRSIRAAAEDQRHGHGLREDFSQLAESIAQMGHGPDIAALRREFDELRHVMDSFAREESVQRIETQWQGLESRMQGVEADTLRDEVVQLAYRIDDIKAQLGAMSDNPVIRALEQKLITIATAMEQLGSRMQPSDALMSEQFTALDQRLDEISRAIAVGSRASANASLDNAFVQRLEGRIGSLAEQIDTIGLAIAEQADPADALAQRIEALTARIEDMTEEQAALHLDERLEQLSGLMKQAQKPAYQSELTQYLSDISEKIDNLGSGSVNDQLAERLDYLARRIDEIHLAPAGQSPQDERAFDRIENRLGDIAARLDEAAAAPRGDDAVLRSLEDQISHLSTLIADPRSSVALPEALDNRMAAIENYMATNDEYIIEAARQAAEAVVEAYSRSAVAGGPIAASDMAALSALAEDLKHLEDLTRGSDERAHQTFDALHGTLVKIADRLDMLEDRFTAAPVAEPAPQPFGKQVRMPAAASLSTPAAPTPAMTAMADVELAAETFARETAGSLYAETDSQVIVPPHAVVEAAEVEKTGLLAGLSKRFRSSSKADVALPREPRAIVEPVPSLDPAEMLPPERENDLIEPGSGAPDVKKILERVRASQAAGEFDNDKTSKSDRADYIAAARRAAKAAAQEADPSLGKAAGSVRPSVKQGSANGLGARFAQHRRPILMAVGAVLLALMAMPLAKNFLGGHVGNGSPKPAAIETPAPQQPAAATPAAPAATQDAPKNEAPASQPADQPLAPPAGQQGGQNGAALEAPAPANDAVAAAPQAAPMGAVEHSHLLSPQAEGGQPAGLRTAATDMPQDGGLVADSAAQPTAPIVVPDSIAPKSLAKAASEGDPNALFEIGARFTDGRGVKADAGEAANWYKLAAGRGLAPAQYRLANLYEKGTGVDRDLAKAMTYYKQAADAGNASAMHNLAVLYASGAAGQPNYAAAVNWFSKAADLGIVDSQFNLAILFARGNGAKQDLEESYKWFAVAAEGGDKDAAQKRDEVAKAMRKDQLESARAKADQWRAQPLDPKANAVNLPDEWASTKSVTTASVDMTKAIRNIQAILNKNGFDAGTPDGKLGNRTVSAIKAFQTSVGQEPNGRINDALVKELLARNK